ncbi:hypothetical protein BDA96_03G209500 [Sorghum bicolor]|uniref:Leucine-rich repeat-containing N-terminal plant-type domain-containing protein n=1 Tax=Sorghum bicolor TaxID=4558 RepID=A0A921UMZ0_SORBI|nr:hypothetical protein BDA96_03G209500 [Sorghum bicolor]
MDVAAIFCFLLVLITTTTTISSSAYAAQFNGACFPYERDALLSFKSGIQSDPQKLLASWNGDDCCRWTGVNCSNSTGHVLKIDLRNSFFLDDLPHPPILSEYPHGMRGKISSSLLALHHLEYLDLSGNLLGGEAVQIPRFLGSLPNLVYLNLFSTDFRGRVPPHLGNLSKLQYLDIDTTWNDEENNMHSEDISWLARLPLLVFLDMSGVNLSITGDWVQVLNKLSNLRVLRLHACQLPFPYPAIVDSNLTSLEIVDLSDNRINTLNPSYWFWHASTIRHLDLMNNMIVGPLPGAMGNMTSLEVLNFGGNHLSDVKAKPLENLCNLRELTLWSNKINQDMAEFLDGLPPCAWSKLELLDLSTTNISGEIPNWINRWTNLSILQLSSNMLVGSIPLEIGMLSKLRTLDLDGNHLTGSISEEHLASLVNLEELDLSYNSVQMVINLSWIPPFKLRMAYFPHCQMGPYFPLWLQGQRDLIYLDISDTGIVDYLPDWFWSVFSNTTYLNISCNQISGKLPRTLEFMSSALIFDFNSNNLTGILPQLPRYLQELDISKNSLSGPLPTKFGAPYLLDLLLSENKITGTIPSYICQLQFLCVLDLAKNHLVGQLPLCFDGSKETQNTSMLALVLYENSLSGNFPLFVQSFPELILLDLAHNKHIGELPTWIAKMLPQLSYLRLRNNMFSGSIPVQLMELGHLQFLDLAYNRISGSIPESLANLTAMIPDQDHQQPLENPLYWSYERPSSASDTYYAKFDDSLEVVSKGQYLDYTSNVVYMVALDLSHNNIVGEIPEEITSLVGMAVLNLSHNQLSGKIPEKIGQLRSLESLDFSWNELSGEIPSSLSDITTLSKLNLSYNNLSGRIPSGNQLQALIDPASSYFGNSYLCGPPLLRNCSAPEVARGYHDGHQSDSDERYLYLGMAVGFVLSLWIVFVTFLFSRTWRVAYFQMFDKLLY